MVPVHAEIGHGGDDVHVAVVVHVGDFQAAPVLARTRGRDDELRERRWGAAFVAVPTDLSVGERRGHDVQIAVAVEVPGSRVQRAVLGRRDRMNRPGRYSAATVFVPRDGVAGARRHDHVEIAVPIEIFELRVFETCGCRTDQAIGPSRNAGAIVFQPPDRVALSVRAQHVDIAVTVDIARLHGRRTGNPVEAATWWFGNDALRWIVRFS